MVTGAMKQFNIQLKQRLIERGITDVDVLPPKWFINTVSRTFNPDIDLINQLIDLEILRTKSNQICVYQIIPDKKIIRFAMDGQQRGYIC